MELRFTLIGLLLLCLTACGAASPLPGNMTPEGAVATPNISTTITNPDVTPDATISAPSATPPLPTDTGVTPDATISAPSETIPPPDTGVTPESVDLSGAAAHLFELEPWLTTVIQPGATLDQIRATLTAAGWLKSETDLREVAFFGTEQAPLWLLRLTVPVAAGEPLPPAGAPGVMYVVDPTTRQILYVSSLSADGADYREDASHATPHVLTDTDFTGDGFVDIPYEFILCEETGCIHQYSVISADGLGYARDILRVSGYDHQGSLRDDLPYVNMLDSQVSFDDVQGDGISDLTVVGGTPGAPSATYAWDGTNLVLIDSSN